MFTHKKLILHGLFYALGVALYAFAVSALMTNGEKIFPSMPDIFTGAIMLTLFCLSAAVVGSLIFARPIFLIITGGKKEGIFQLVFTLTWLLVLLVIGFSLIAIFAKNNVSAY